MTTMPWLILALLIVGAAVLGLLLWLDGANRRDIDLDGP